MNNKAFDVIIETSIRNDNKSLWSLQKQVSTRLRVNINETDVEYFEFTGDTAQILLSLTWEAIKMIDSAVIGIFATEIYNYLKANKGTGNIQITTKKENENLDLELKAKNPSKEDLELQITQYADTVLSNLNQFRPFTKENRYEKKITFVYDEKRKLIVPIDYSSVSKNIEDMFKGTSHWKS